MAFLKIICCASHSPLSRKVLARVAFFRTELEFLSNINTLLKKQLRLYRPLSFLPMDSGFNVVDYGGVLTLVPAVKDPVQQGAGILKGNGSLTSVIVEEHGRLVKVGIILSK